MGQSIQPNSVVGKNKISTLQHKNQMERGNIVDGAAMPFMTDCVILKSTHINCFYYFGSGFFCCKVVLVLEGEVWQLITQHSRILSLSIYVGNKKKENKIPLNA